MDNTTEQEQRCTAIVNNCDALGSRLWNLCDDKDNAPSIAEMQLLIAKGADVNMTINGQTVLMRATRNCYLDAVKMLLAIEGIYINARDSKGFIAFEGCVHFQIAKALLAALMLTSDFDINDTTKFEQTVLMLALDDDVNLEVIKLLLSIPHINIHLKDDKGETALDYADFADNLDEIRALFNGELLPLQLPIKSINTLDCTLLLFISHHLSISDLLYCALYALSPLTLGISFFFCSQLLIIRI
jgi:ankyrin repeat protein